MHVRRRILWRQLRDSAVWRAIAESESTHRVSLHEMTVPLRRIPKSTSVLTEPMSCVCVRVTERERR